MSNTIAIAGAGHGYGAIPSIGGTYSIGVQHEFEAGMDLRITPANGGHIISLSHRNSGAVPELHIVTEDKDLGTEIGKIITMSCLKKENK